MYAASRFPSKTVRSSLRRSLWTFSAHIKVDFFAQLSPTQRRPRQRCSCHFYSLSFSCLRSLCSHYRGMAEREVGRGLGLGRVGFRWDQKRWWWWWWWWLLLWWLLLFTWSDCLHVLTDRRDVVAREHARLAVAASFPPVGVRVVQDLNEVAASETQLAFLLGVKVEERLHICGILRDRKMMVSKTAATGMQWN